MLVEQLILYFIVLHEYEHNDDNDRQIIMRKSPRNALSFC